MLFFVMYVCVDHHIFWTEPGLFTDYEYISILDLFLTISSHFSFFFNQKLCSRTITIVIQTIIVFPLSIQFS